MIILSVLGAATSQGFLDYLSKAGVITLLIVIVYGGYKKWWVFGWFVDQYTKQCEERIGMMQHNLETLEEEKNAWRETALKGANIATQAFEEARRAPRREAR